MTTITETLLAKCLQKPIHTYSYFYAMKVRHHCYYISPHIHSKKHGTLIGHRLELIKREASSNVCLLVLEVTVLVFSSLFSSSCSIFLFPKMLRRLRRIYSFRALVVNTYLHTKCIKAIAVLGIFSKNDIVQ